MKKFFVIGMVLLLSILCVSIAQAETKVVLDGKKLTFDAPPIVEDGRTLVPLRVIFEALGASVQWDPVLESVTATKGNTVIKLFIQGQAYKNDVLVNLDVPTKLVNGRTMVPLRFVSETFGASVSWDAAAETVTITSAPTQPKQDSKDIYKDFLTYENTKYDLRVKYPKDWIKKENNMGFLVTFLSTKENESDTSAENVIINVQDLTGQSVTLEDITNATLLFSKKYFNDFKLIESETTTISGGSANKITCRMKQGVYNLKLMQIHTIKNDRVYTFTYTATEDTYSKYLDIVQDMVDSVEIGLSSSNTSTGS